MYIEFDGDFVTLNAKRGNEDLAKANSGLLAIILKHGKNNEHSLFDRLFNQKTITQTD